ELRDLARSYDGLTEAAQQVLRAEMQKRGLGDPSAPSPPVRVPPRGDLGPWEDDREVPEPTAAERDDAEDGEDTVDFTWKTPLCECEEREEALALREALRRAGIESWFEGPHSRSNWDLRFPRILV